MNIITNFSFNMKTNLYYFIVVLIQCIYNDLQSRTFELRCNYTGYSPRLDIILTSLPRLYNVQGSTDNLMSLILPVRGNSLKTLLERLKFKDFYCFFILYEFSEAILQYHVFIKMNFVMFWHVFSLQKSSSTVFIKIQMILFM